MTPAGRARRTFGALPSERRPPYGAVVFDFDGVIVDTETPQFEAWREIFAEHGVAPMAMAEWSTMLGRPSAEHADPLDLLVGRLGHEVDRDEVQRRRRQLRDEHLAREAVRPGVVAWLDCAAEHGAGIAIASSSEPEWVEWLLDRHGLRHRFPVLSCFGHERPGKPDPFLYVDACRTLGVAPATAVAVEDSPTGVASAVAAGLWCIAVAAGISRLLDLSAADERVDSLAGLDPATYFAPAGASPAGGPGYW